MKKLSYIFKAFAAAAALTATFTACQDDIDAPGVEIPEATITPNTTLAELKAMFWDDATNYADTIRDKEDPSRRYVIHGRVISSDEQSNVFKSLVIQDETAALAFSIDAYNLYQNYRVGQELVLDVTDMFIGKYAGLQQMGRPSWYANGKTYQVSFMSLEYFQSKVQLNGIPQPALNDTLVVNTFSEIANTAEGMMYWQSRLVRFKNVYFADGGQKNFSVYHSSANEDQNRTIVDRNGGTMIVRTSGYASFCEDRLPVGNVDVVGLLSYYNSNWQIILIDRQGVVEVGDVPGSKEKPYTVPEAIADIANGVQSKGWVKGYIVGALAPEVENVGSNADIEWGAPTVTASTIVIAPDADCREITECLLVALPAESTFQQVANLRDNPDVLGREILVLGDLTEYLGTYGLTGNSGKSDEFSIEGLNVGGAIPDGDGSESSPLNVSQVVAMNPTSTTASPDGGTGVWVEGYIVGSMPTGGSSTTLSGTNFSTVDAATTNLVLGPTPDCTDYTKCVGIQLPANMRSELALANQPGNLGKRLAVKGDVMKYCGGPGVKNLTEKKFEGGGDTPVTPPSAGDFPDGDGQQATPYNVGQIISMNPSSTTEAVQTGVWVKGYIVGSMPTGGSSTTLSGTNFSTVDAATTNLVLGPTATCTDPSQCIGIQLPANMRAELALANQPGNLGKVLEVKGDVMKYCGGPGIKNLTDKSLAGAVTPPTPGVTPSGDGTEASPYNVERALEVIAAMSASDSKTAFVKGKIASITEVSTSFGNATYTICDVTGGKTLGVYRGYWLNGDKFTSADQLAVGAEVVVTGDLVNYMGNTPQFTTGNKIVSYNGAGGTPDTPDTPTPDDPVTPADGTVIALSAFSDVSGDSQVVAEGFTFDIAKGEGSTNPKYYSNGMRLYAQNTIKISGKRMTKITFTLATNPQYGPFTPSTGTINPAQESGDTTLTWEGDATEVTFAVGKDSFADASKRGQIRFTEIVIKAE